MVSSPVRSLLDMLGGGAGLGIRYALCDLLLETYHVSRITYHISRITYHISRNRVISKYESRGIRNWLVGCGEVGHL